MTRISLYKEDFQKAVLKVVGVVGNKIIKPILEGIKIEFVDNKVVFTASDLESTIKIEPKFTFAEGSGFVVNAKDLAEVAKNLVPDNVILEADEKLKITNGTGEIILPVFDLEDYPVTDDPVKNESFEIDKDVFKKSVDDVFPYAGTDEYVKNLNCIRFEVNKNVLRLVAADGFRLAYSDNYIRECDSAQTFSFSVSSKGVKNMISLLGDFNDRNVRVFYSSKNVSLSLENVFYTSRTLDVQFPDYQAIIPLKFDTVVNVDKNVFLKNLKFVNVVSKKTGESVRIAFTEDNCNMQVKAINLGESSINFFVRKQGEDVANAFNPKFLLEAFARIELEGIMKLQVKENAPCIIQDSSKEHSLVQVIMPLRSLK